MATKTITTTTSISTGTLSSGYNPLSITSTGTVTTSTGSAIYGPAGATNTWTITNSGLITTPDITAAGIQLGGILTIVQSGTVSNSGTITGGAYGVALNGPGTIANQSGGLISATSNANAYASALYLFDYSAPTPQPQLQVINQGTLTGPIGAYERSAGSITNAAGGIITGTSTDGIRLGSTSDSVVNSGLVSGQNFGIEAYDGGTTITNLASGTIEGPTAVEFFGGGFGGTFDNAGTVTSTGTYAVDFAGTGGSYRLIARPGAVFSGNIVGGNGAVELAASGAGTLSGFGTTITNFSALQFDPSASWRISGNQSGLGTMAITGFAAGDTIDLTGFVATSQTFASGTLTLANTTGTVTLQFPDISSLSAFNIAPVGSSGTDITGTCYAAGTRILTPSGEAPIELLRRGDLVLTVSGRSQTIQWIGHRRVDFRNHPKRQRILPVRIVAHAFGPGRPRRDLLLSPDHAVFVEDVLIPIRHLINGSNVTQVERDTISYYHIELPQHDVLLADGMPAESYLEAGARSAFANGDDVIQLHPDFAPPQDYYATLWEQYGYAPLVVAGEVVERVRGTLADNRYAA